MRLIDADALIEKFENLKKEAVNIKDILFLDGTQTVVDSMPTVEK